MAETFVLLHGGIHGGWCYRELARVLRARGHDAFTPTLTGHGERAHLQHDITMETHILDVVNVLEYEDLHGIVLVGHSMGGIVVPFVALRAPARIKRVVWLTALVVPDGAKGEDRDVGAYSPWLAKVAEARAQGEPQDVLYGRHLDAFMQEATPEQRRWAKARLGGPADAIRAEPSRLDDFLALGLPTAYIFATRDRALPLDYQRECAARLPGCVTVEVAADHDLMVTAPEATADALERVAAAT
jgi:pimeloyl-ACP methyl ester carboxylesterase